MAARAAISNANTGGNHGQGKQRAEERDQEAEEGRQEEVTEPASGGSRAAGAFLELRIEN
jgi:hypothetical protein